MADPTPNCPDPDAPDFLRCLATWELKNTLYPGVSYVVIYRCIDNLGNVDQIELDRTLKRWQNRRAKKPTITKPPSV